MSSSPEEVKPKAYPSTYVVPDQWTHDGAEGMNQPTAGKRFDKELSRGKHDLQLYSLGTPNGQKVTILLEELGVEYDAWPINIMELQQFGSDFVDINPNSKIPALLDYSMESGDAKPLRVFETGSILLYLAEREKRFLPTDPRKKTECMNWLMWQMGTGPIIGGGFGHFFNYAPIKIEYAIDRYSMEAKRIVDVLDKHLADGDKKYVCGDEYTIADMAIFPWMRALYNGYNGAASFLNLSEYVHVQRWMKSLEERDAVKRGLRVNGWGEDSVQERHSKDDFAHSKL